VGAEADRVEIRGLRLSGICGVLPEEQVRAQPLEVDLDLVLSLAEAGASDDLADTVDYGAVCDLVERVVAEGRPQLLEHLAERLAAEVLAVGGIDEVVVGVRKLRPPVPQQLATSGVRITRRAA
jgi:dihydroneopterin aldolase